MAYLGNAPARSFISFERQVFTIVNSQTAYTLSHSVNNENDIRLVINNIVQEPGSGKAYTASGTTLTLSAALTNGTDEMYCVFLGRATATNAPGAGSVGTAAIADLNVTTAKIAADAITEAKIADDAVESEHLNNNVISGQTALGATPADTDEFLVSDAGTIKRVDYSYLKGGTNTPAFYVYPTSNQSIANTTDVTIAFDTEVYDTASAFTSNTFTVPSGQGGKYCIFFSISRNNFSCTRFTIKLDVAGTEKAIAENASGRNYDSAGLSVVLPLNAGDAVFLKVYQDSGSTQTILGNQKRSFFGGYKIIE